MQLSPQVTVTVVTPSFVFSPPAMHDKRKRRAGFCFFFKNQVTCKCLSKQKSSNVFHPKHPSCGHSRGLVTVAESSKRAVYLKLLGCSGLMEVMLPRVNTAVHARAHYSKFHHYTPINTQHSISSICSSKTVLSAPQSWENLKCFYYSELVCAPWAGSSRSFCATIMAVFWVLCCHHFLIGLTSPFSDHIHPYTIVSDPSCFVV